MRAGEGGTSVDFCEHVARPLPSAVIARVLGVPKSDVPHFAIWSDEILQRITESGSSRPLGDLHPDFAAYVDAQIEARRSRDAASGDFITRMLVTDVDGERLSVRAVRTQLVNLIIAGNETTRNLIGNLFYRLALEPDLWRRLQTAPELRAVAIEESLRIDSPVQFLARSCTREIELAGVSIKKGDRVLFGIASANFDESYFKDADRFRLDRDRPREHLGFGAGPHLCPGAFLARMEARAALDTALERIDRIELDPDYVFDTNPIPFTYGPNTLQIRIRAHQSS
jgi:cytochrome P450